MQGLRVINLRVHGAGKKPLSTTKLSLQCKRPEALRVIKSDQEYYPARMSGPYPIMDSGQCND